MSRQVVSFVRRALMLTISLAYAVWRSIAAGFGLAGRAAPVVLTYHAVSDADLARFERQMVSLKKRGTPVFADADPTPAHERRIAVTFDDAFQHVFDRVLPILCRHEIPATIFVPTGYIGGQPGWIHPSARRTKDAVASADALASADRRLVKLGSHSVTHPRLAGIDATALRRELESSKKTLEQIAGIGVGMIALPYGSCAPHVVTAAARAGYQRVFANVPVGNTYSILTGRTDVSPRDWSLEFRLKASGAYEWMAFAVPAKRQVLQLLGRPQEA